MSRYSIVSACLLILVAVVLSGGCGSPKTVHLNDETAGPLLKKEALTILMEADRVALDQTSGIENYARRIAVSDSSVIVTYAFEHPPTTWSESGTTKIILAHSLELQFSRATLRLISVRSF